MTPGPILSHTKVVAEGSTPTRWLYLVHGIYGSGRNWGSVARRLVDERPEWGVILVDLRLHGGSTGEFAPPHTVRACADDVERLAESLGLPAKAVLGHSFGGKVALLFAQDADGSIEQAWVADSTLRVGEPSGSAWRVVEIARGLPSTFASRDELAEAMVANGYERGMGQWLAMNLERDGDRFRWRLDWDGVEEMLRDYFRTDVWAIVDDPPAGTDLHFIRAIRSEAIDGESARRLHGAGATVHLHEVDAGHWLNVDNPEAVLDLLNDHLTNAT